MNKIEQASFEAGYYDAKAWKRKNYFAGFGKVDEKSYNKSYIKGSSERGYINRQNTMKITTTKPEFSASFLGASVGIVPLFQNEYKRI